jgi:hypothetical protein
MATDYIGKSSKELDAIAANSSSFEQMREAMKAHLQGVPQAPESTVTADGQTGASESHMRVVYPHLNDRYEIYGVSEAALDAKEKQLREMFGK